MLHHQFDLDVRLRPASAGVALAEIDLPTQQTCAATCLDTCRDTCRGTCACGETGDACPELHPVASRYC